MNWFRGAVAVGAGLVLTAAAQSAVISTDTVASFSSQLSDFDRHAANVTNNSFVAQSSGGDSGPAHTNLPGKTMWLTNTGDTDPFIVIDLGSQQTLGSMRVWNYNEVGLSPGNEPWTGRGAKDVQISVSTTSASSGFTSAGSFQFAQAPGSDGYLGEAFAFAQTARWVRFDIDTNWNGNAAFGFGLSEVQFDTNPIPEPSMIAAVGLGAMALVRRRRR